MKGVSLNNNYDGLDFDREELSSVMRKNYDEIISFITQPSFQSVFAEMMSLNPTKRPIFVDQVLLDSQELKKRGVIVPDGILIQMSAFGDRRPTLFVVKKFLPEKYRKAWENVNYTFNNEFKEEDVPSDPESSWRLPLLVSVQNALISNNIDLQDIENDSVDLVQRLDSNDIINSEKRTI
jgi:hypothetical protein